jgi:large subunit ribosomal protein L25
METKSLAAEVRTEKGKNASYRLREQGLIPGVVYSHGKSASIQVDRKDFRSIFKGHISESTIVDLNVKGDKDYQVYVKDYQLNPITDEIQHIDFFKVTKGEKIKTTIELEFIGNSAGVKAGGVFDIIDRVMEVEVLPKDLSEKIEVDITNLEIGESIQLKDLKVPESMTFISDPEHVVAHCIKARAAMELETEETVAEEGEAEAVTEAAE